MFSTYQILLLKFQEFLIAKRRFIYLITKHIVNLQRLSQINKEVLIVK